MGIYLFSGIIHYILQIMNLGMQAFFTIQLLLQSVEQFPQEQTQLLQRLRLKIQRCAHPENENILK